MTYSSALFRTPLSPGAPPVRGAAMTRNGVKYKCHCNRCRGAFRDWRTIIRHAEASDRPLFPPSLEEKSDPINKEDDHADHDMDVDKHDDDPIMANPADTQADLVSHVESLPNCNEPVYSRRCLTHYI